MNAIILASGPGKRMLPWTKTCPKIMFKVDGKPLLYHYINNLKRVGVKNIVITVSHLEKPIIDALNLALPLISPYDLIIDVFREKKLLGSAGACKKIMDDNKWDRAIIIYGDTWFEPWIYKNIDYIYPSLYNYIMAETQGEFFYGEMRNRWGILRGEGLIRYEPTRETILEIAEDGKLKGKTGMIAKNAGVMVLNRNVLTKKKGDLMKDVLAKDTRWIVLYPASPKSWCDLGTIEGYTRLVKSKNKNADIAKGLTL